MKWLFALLFGCPHSVTTFPMTPDGFTSPHVLCLDRGKRFEYSWDEMRIGVEVNR